MHCCEMIFCTVRGIQTLLLVNSKVFQGLQCMPHLHKFK